MVDISESENGSIFVIQDHVIARFPDIENFQAYAQAEMEYAITLNDWLTEREARRPQVPDVIKEAFGE